MEAIVIEASPAREAHEGSRTVRNIIVLSALVLGTALLTAAVAERGSNARGPGVRTLDEGPRPLPGRRY